MIVDAIHSTALFGDCAEVETFPAQASALQLTDKDVTRTGTIIVNDSNSVVWIKYGAGITSTNYSFKLRRDDILIIDDFRGEVYALWNAVNGQIILTNYFR